MSELLNQTKAAARLALTTRQLRRIPDEFTGRLADGRYPFPECQRGYVRFKQEDELRRRGHAATRAGEYSEARARKVAAQARLAELKVAEVEGRLVPLPILREGIAMIGDRVAAFLKNIPGTWPPILVRFNDPRALSQELRKLVDEQIEEIRGLVDDLIEPGEIDRTTE